MQVPVSVIGVDPGQTTGICLLDLELHEVDHLQLTPRAVLPVVRALTKRSAPVLVAVERYVVGTRSSRSSSPKAGQITRDLVGQLLGLADHEGLLVVARSAAEVKPWATDERLERAGLLVKGMRHANDAARHALFAAVKDCGAPDPLSSRSTWRAAP